MIAGTLMPWLYIKYAIFIVSISRKISEIQMNK